MPVLSQVNVKGSRVCFECQEEALPKTGRTVVVKESTPDAAGKVTITDVNSKQETSMDLLALSTSHKGEIVIRLTVSELVANGIITTLLQSTYDAIDNMPPFKTLKETKQAIALQEDIQTLLSPKKKRKVTIVDPALEGE